MATDVESDPVERFGPVDRTVGTVFRYALLAATLFGIVTLFALLVFVANDALQPLTADPGWHLVFLLTLVVPAVALGSYLYRRNVAALALGVTTLGTLVVGLVFSGGVAMVFVDVVSPLAWFGYLVALAVPVAVVIGIGRFYRDVPFHIWFGAATVAFYASLFGVPGPAGTLVGVPDVVPGIPTLVQMSPVAPPDWTLIAGSLGVGVALAVAAYGHRLRGVRAGRFASGAFAAIVLGGMSGPSFGVDPLPATVLAAIALVPTGAYVGGALVTRPQDRVGLLLPAVVVVGALLGSVVVDLAGFAGPQSWVDWQFLTSAHSGTAANAGLYPAIGGSILLMVTVAALSFPVGVGAAVYLEEYAPENRFTRIIDVNISNLAGVPSVVYGLLGLGLIVTYLGRSPGTVLVGGATLALLILPIVIISSREAIRSVPDELRQASYGMGATRWQTVRNVVLPRAFPAILTGTILSLGRAIGETAPLIMIGAPNVLFSLPTELSSKVSAMPLQVYAWASLFASEEFYTRAVPAGVVVLVSVLLAMNSVAIVLRNRYQGEQ